MIYVDHSIFVDGVHPDDVIATFNTAMGDDIIDILSGLRPGAGNDMAHSWYTRDQLVRLLDGEFTPANDEQEDLLLRVNTGEWLDLSLPGYEGAEGSPKIRKTTTPEMTYQWEFVLVGDPVHTKTVREAVQILVDQSNIV